MAVLQALGLMARENVFECRVESGELLKVFYHKGHDIVFIIVMRSIVHSCPL